MRRPQSPTVSKSSATTALLCTLSLLACGPSTTEQAPDVAEHEVAPVSETAETPEPVPPEPTPTETAAERAARVHREAIVFDAHCDAVMKVVDDGVDLGVRSDEGHVDYVRMAEGGLDVEVFAVWVEPEYWPNKAKQRALQMIDALHRSFESHADKIGLARTVADARRLVAQGKLAGFIGIEGGHAIEDDKSALEMFFDKGVRYMTLTWWHNTNWADGSGDKPKHHGLNDLGREIVREMNRLGMVVDLSHVSDETFWDVLEVTDKPVICSHSNTRALADHHRNLTDDQLRALAKNGGVIGINYVASFLDSDFNAASNKLRARLKPRMDKLKQKFKHDPREGRRRRWALWREKAAELPQVPLDKMIDHIDHAVKIAGVDHVGLGSDFDGYSVGPQEIEDCTSLPLVTVKLLERGYSEEDVRKILGGNLLRVFEANFGR
jgi:membrane dipeptidase